MTNDRTLSIQRDLLLGVTKSYGTVSTEAFTIYSGVLSLDLCTGLERDNKTLTRKRKSVEGTDILSKTVEIWSAVPFRLDL